MKILDGFWTPKVNMLEVECDCGQRHFHPANRMGYKCPRCGKIVNVFKLKTDESTDNKHRQ